VSARAAFIILTATLVSSGCTTRPLEQLPEARRVSEDLLVQFTKAADASNRAVMADTDEVSVRFAREAEQMVDTVQKDTDALKPLLQDLGYAEEARLLEEFGRRFAEYRALDRTILELAVENTNLKAQRLSFGPAQDAADAFRTDLEALVPANRAKEEWHVKALVATAIAAVREIQVLDAPHIAEPDDAAMTRIEERMTAAGTAARNASAALASLVDGPSRSRLAAATAALERFRTIHAEILALSRRNSNVRSLALTLDQKGKLTPLCEDALGALRDALARRSVGGTR
jgi:hypothetical protein